MASLPGWVEDRLTAHNVHVIRYGRLTKGRPTDLQRRWFFCGWYYHREVNRCVVDGPHGPFPRWSAAMVDALTRYKLSND